jgi:hypothetical protein
LRLIDEIQNSDNGVPLEVRQFLTDAQIIVADDVTEYYFALNDKEYWDVADFPNVAPPFKKFWMETRHPSKIVSSEYGSLPWKSTDDAHRPKQWGALFQSLPPEALAQHPSGTYTLEDCKSVKWVVKITLIVQRENGLHPVWEWMMPITADGLIWTRYDVPLHEKVSGFSYTLNPTLERSISEPGGVEMYRGYRAMYHAFIHPFLLAISFMHCKNVEISTVHPPPKLRAKQARRGIALHSYRVINVGPIKRMLAAARLPSDSDITVAVHRCRGHFKTYTAERPLLGRAVGTFFWEDHVRGSKSRGEVTKEYAVKP